VKRIACCLTLLLLAAPAGLLAQTSSSVNASQSSSATPDTPSGYKADHFTPPKPSFSQYSPFSHLAFSGGIGIGGINLQAAINASRNFNIRGTGNVFSYTVNNIDVSGGGGSSGINVTGKLNFASAGLSLDYYPFSNHGFRLSPGMTLYNENGVSASGIATQRTSITLGSTKYYSEGGANAMSLNANLGLNTHKQAFTMTTGWGNLISRRGGHFSVPFEIGAIFTGVPTLGLNITGFGCTNSADVGITGAGASCVNMATNSAAQTNLNSQVAKYQSDLNPLKVYPILSIGFGYNFKIR
jgi:hypothetical protein